MERYDTRAMLSRHSTAAWIVAVLSFSTVAQVQGTEAQHLPEIRWSRAAGMVKATIRSHPAQSFQADSELVFRLRDEQGLDLSWHEPIGPAVQALTLRLPLGGLDRPERRWLSVSCTTCRSDTGICGALEGETVVNIPGPFGGRIKLRAKRSPPPSGDNTAAERRARAEHEEPRQAPVGPESQQPVPGQVGADGFRKSPQQNQLEQTVTELRTLAEAEQWQQGWKRVQILLAGRPTEPHLRYQILKLSLLFAEQSSPGDVPDLAAEAAELAPTPGEAATLVERGARALRESGSEAAAALLVSAFAARLEGSVAARHPSRTTTSADRMQLSGELNRLPAEQQADLAQLYWLLGSWSQGEEAHRHFERAALRAAAAFLPDPTETATDQQQIRRLKLPEALLSDAASVRLEHQQDNLHNIVRSLAAARLHAIALPLCSRVSQRMERPSRWTRAQGIALFETCLNGLDLSSLNPRARAQKSQLEKLLKSLRQEAAEPRR